MNADGRAALSGQEFFNVYQQGYERGSVSFIRKIRVLVVDDEELLCYSLDRCLSTENCEVIATTFSEVGLSLIRQYKFDVAVLDIFMKPIDGLELVKELRNHDTSCKIILISAFLAEEIKKELERFEVDEFIEKPYDLRLIQDKVMELAK